jgi:adenine-specific DNA-methyltransferase
VCGRPSSPVGGTSPRPAFGVRRRPTYDCWRDDRVSGQQGVPVDHVRRVADLFTGTGVVAKAFANQGMQVTANDQLVLCATLAEAALLRDVQDPFSVLATELARGRGETAYQAVLRTLNQSVAAEGFFFRTYSPASSVDGDGRMYLTEQNAARTDAMRSQIETWSPLLSRWERAILLRDLVRAVTSVSNTAGTFGCYLKSWKARALNPIRLAEGPLGHDRGWVREGHRVTCGEVAGLAPALRDVDAAYLDPPYTKRQYAAYYHLLETLVANTTPSVTGSTGLPNWAVNQSDFCYKRKAPTALSHLVASLDVPILLVSYSSDGHIAHDEMVALLERHGQVGWSEAVRPRYRSGSGAGQGSNASVIERLYRLDKG